MSKAASFTYAGGVLSKGLWGRVDLEKYQTGLKRADNFSIAVEGGAEKRFGFYYIGLRNDQTKVSRLIPWRVSDDDSYMMEFSEERIRFIRLGGLVSIPAGFVHASGNMAYNDTNGYMTIDTPYAAEDLKYIKFTSANDIFEITCKGYAPQKLTRMGLYDWKIAAKNFSPHPAGPSWSSLVYHNDTTEADNYDDNPVLTTYAVSYTDANGVESLASVADVYADTGHQRCYVALSWTAVADAIQYTVYKGKNGIYGFIGRTEPGVTSYEDRNYAPSYDTVPIGTAYTWPAGEYPSVTEYWKQRQMYASSESNPQRLIASKPLVFESLYHSIPQLDDDAIDMTLVGRERHTINHMIELKKFIIFTDTAEWVLATDNNAPLTIATANPTKETNYGADPLIRPLAIGNRIIFVQNRSGAVRDMGYEYTADSFSADDLSRLARDLFKNKRITSWGYSIDPGNLMPTCMSDGSMNVQTYAREHEIWGWARWFTQGNFIDVACVDETDCTAIYVQVERTINGTKTYFIERMEFNFNDRIEDMVYVDCALTFKSSLAFTDLVRVSDVEATLTVVDNTYSVDDELQIELSDTDFFRGKVTAVAGNDVTISPVRTTEFQEFSSTEGSVYLCVATVTGYDHLYGEAIWVLADGKVFKQLSIQPDGSVDLPIKAARVHIGLPYSATLETLDLDIKQLEGQYIDKTVDMVTIRLRNSRAVAIQATNAEEFREPYYIPSRNDENMYLPPSALDGVYELPTHVGWGQTAGIRVISNDPLPCNVLNIVPDMQYGS